MFQIGWAEMMVIGVVALIVIGPEDLPDMFRQLGRFTAKLRSMGREFQRAMDQASKDTGLKDVAKDLASVTSPKAMGLDAVKSAADKFEKWDPIKNAAKPVTKVAKAATAGEAAADSADMAMEARTSLATSSMTAVSSLASVADLKAADLKAAETPKDTQNSIMGPETAKLYDKQAARAAVMAESAAKLKAIDAAEALPPVATKPKSKPRAAKLAEPVSEVIAVKSARVKKSAEPAAEPVKAPRKTKPVKADIA